MVNSQNRQDVNQNQSLILPNAGLPLRSPNFHPDRTQTTSPEYNEFLRVRQIILNVIRNDTPQKRKVLDDLVEVLLENDVDLPTDIISGALKIIGVGKKVREIRKKREIYTNVIISILEQIFDPLLEYKMTTKDILDAFEANGINRNNANNNQLNQIYVKVIHKLQVGELRDLTFEEQLYRYVQLKLTEIKISRQDWELNWK